MHDDGNKNRGDSAGLGGIVGFLYMMGMMRLGLSSPLEMKYRCWIADLSYSGFTFKVKGGGIG